MSTANLAVPRLLKLAEVCERLAISRAHAYNLIHEDRFPVPVVRLGSALRFRESEVDSFLRGEA